HARHAHRVDRPAPHTTGSGRERGQRREARADQQHRPYYGTRSVGGGSYTWKDNYREVYFSPAKPTPYDGTPGTYTSLNGGRWYGLGQYPTGLIALPPKPR